MQMLLSVLNISPFPALTKSYDVIGKVTSILLLWFLFNSIFSRILTCKNKFSKSRIFWLAWPLLDSDHARKNKNKNNNNNPTTTTTTTKKQKQKTHKQQHTQTTTTTTITTTRTTTTTTTTTATTMTKKPHPTASKLQSCCHWKG